MSLSDRIRADLTASMKAKDAARTSALRMVRTEVLNLEKSGEAVDDEAIVKALQRLMKQRQEAAEQYDAAGRTQQAAGERAEAEIIAAYLPAALSTQEMEALVEEALQETNATAPKDMGRVMGLVMQRAKATGKALDAKAASDLIKQRLGA